MSYNYDRIKNIEPAFVGTYQEAKDLLEENSYICPPIVIEDKDEREKFDQHFRVIDRFQSGNVKYGEKP